MPQLHLTQKKLDGSLFDACATGNVTYAMLALAAGADVNGSQHNRVTPLHVVSLKGYLEIARLLIDQGADIGAKDVKGRTPLHFAILRGYTDITELLRKAAKRQDKYANRLFKRRDRRGRQDGE